jgi:hypothetical protein
MIAAGLVELFLGVHAAQRSLEDIATPLTAEEAEQDGDRTSGDRRDGDVRTRDRRETVSTGSSRRLYH